MAATERPPLRGASVDTRVLAVRGRRRCARARDRLAGEEPLEIRAAGPARRPCASRSRCARPGDDFELAAGFLHAEGLLHRRSSVIRDQVLRPTSSCGEQAYNVVTVHLRRPFERRLVQRNFCVTSSLRRLRQGLDRPIEVRLASRCRRALACRAHVIGALPERLRDRAAHVRAHGRPARGRAVHAGGRADRSCARTSAATTRSTRSSATACSPGATPLVRARSRSSPAARRSSSCRRRRSRASRCCARSARRRAWRSTPHAGSA